MADSGGGRAGKGRGEPLPALAEEPIADRLAGPPPPGPAPGETPHDRLRRRLLAEPGVWMVLNTRSALRESAARRLARSYLHAKPARLDPAAAGRFEARPFTRDGTWLVAAAYLPPKPPPAAEPAASGSPAVASSAGRAG